MRCGGNPNAIRSSSRERVTFRNAWRSTAFGKIPVLPASLGNIRIAQDSRAFVTKATLSAVLKTIVRRQPEYFSCASKSVWYPNRGRKNIATASKFGSLVMMVPFRNLFEFLRSKNKGNQSIYAAVRRCNLLKSQSADPSAEMCGIPLRIASSSQRLITNKNRSGICLENERAIIKPC
jgi:hypothetical protein